MPLPNIERDLQALREIVARYPQGVAAAAIEAALHPALPRRTLGRRLAEAVRQGIVRREGTKAAALYFAVPEQIEARFEEEGQEVKIPLSKAAQGIREYLARPQANRKPVGYDQDWLEQYQPGTTYYLPESVRAHLARIGRYRLTLTQYEQWKRNQ
jgi:hypothetical protein